jgi:hypothetical protein
MSRRHKILRFQEAADIRNKNKRQPSLTENQNLRVAQYSFLFVVRSTCFGQKTIIIFNSTKTSNLTFQSPHRRTYVTNKVRLVTIIIIII